MFRVKTFEADMVLEPCLSLMRDRAFLFSRRDVLKNEPAVVVGFYGESDGRVVNRSERHFGLDPDSIGRDVYRFTGHSRKLLRSDRHRQNDEQAA